MPDDEFFDYTDMKAAIPEAKNLKIVLNVESKNLADIVFVVGENQERILSHRKLLSLVNSDIFRKMCCGADKNKDIMLPDVEPEAFKELLRFVFTQNAKLTKENMLSIYAVAQNFEVESLLQECRKFICDNVARENLLDVFEFNKLYEDAVINERCKEMILEDPVNYFTVDQFKNVIEEFLKLLAKSNDLALTEVELLTLTLKWVAGGGGQKFLMYLLQNFKPQDGGKAFSKEMNIYGILKSSAFCIDISSLCFEVKKSIYLHRIGFYFGSPSHHNQSADLWVEVYEELKDSCESIPNKLIYKKYTSVMYTKYVSIKFFQFENVMLEQDKTYIVQINYRFDKFYKLNRQPQNIERYFMEKETIKLDENTQKLEIINLVLNNKFTYNTTFHALFYTEA